MQDIGTLDANELRLLASVPWRSILAHNTAGVSSNYFEATDTLQRSNTSLTRGEDLDGSNLRLYLKFIVLQDQPRATTKTTTQCQGPGYILVVTNLESVWIQKLQGERSILREIAAHSPSFSLNGAYVALSYLDESLGRSFRSSPDTDIAASDFFKTLLAKSSPACQLDNSGNATGTDVTSSTYSSSLHQHDPSTGLRQNTLDLHANLRMKEALLKWTFRCHALTRIDGIAQHHEAASARFLARQWSEPLIQAVCAMAFHLADVGSGSFLKDADGQYLFMPPQLPPDEMSSKRKLLETFKAQHFDVITALATHIQSSKSYGPSKNAVASTSALAPNVAESNQLALTSYTNQIVNDSANIPKSSDSAKPESSSNDTSSVTSTNSESIKIPNQEDPPSNSSNSTRFETTSESEPTNHIWSTEPRDQISTESKISEVVPDSELGIPRPRSLQSDNAVNQGNMKKVLTMSTTASIAEDADAELQRRQALDQIIRQQQRAKATKKKQFV